MTTVNIDDLRDDLLQDGQWHPDSFRVIYHHLTQDPRPFAVLHQQGIDGLRHYKELVDFACAYISCVYVTDHTGDKQATKMVNMIERLVYDDAQALWRSFTAHISRDNSYNERYFDIISLMGECLKTARHMVSIVA